METFATEFQLTNKGNVTFNDCTVYLGASPSVEQHSKGSFLIFYPEINLYLKGNEMVLTDSQQVVVTPKFVDKRGKAASIDGPVVFASSDVTIATVEALSPDGASAKVVAAGELGHVQISASADADLGSGVRPVVLLLEVDVVGGEAVGGTLEAGAPEEQPL